MNYTGVIYELVDPRDGRCRYVGQTFCLQRREYQHMQLLAYQGNIRLCQWKRELYELGLKPQLVPIEYNISPNAINERERFWVATRTNEGFDLLNCPVGSIRREDLFGVPERQEIALTIRELRESLLAIRGRYDLPKKHSCNQLWSRAEKVLLQLGQAFTDF